MIIRVFTLSIFVRYICYNTKETESRKGEQSMKVKKLTKNYWKVKI